MAPPAAPPRQSRPRWGLISFWAVILLGAGAGAAYLQYLGPPPAELAAAPPAPPARNQAAATPPADIIVAATIGTQSNLPHGAPVPPPEAQLLTASSIDKQWQVPRIAPDGATPMQTYAASQLPPADAALLPPNVPRVAIVVAGLGNDAGLAKIAAGLPPEISLALSPYAAGVADAAAEARAAGHETLLLLPMPGLLAGAPQIQNQETLDWSMSRFEGYAGVTDAFGPAMGDGFMANAAARTWLMTNIAKQGLFYIEGDPNAGTAPYAAGRTADIVIDAADGPANLTVQLAELVTDAQSQHAALGIMLNPTADALRTVAAWSQSLVNEDILLVPVSALVLPPDIPLPLATKVKP